MSSFNDIPRYRSAISMRCNEGGAYTFTGSVAATFTLPNVNPAQMRPDDQRMYFVKNAGTALLTIAANSGNFFNWVSGSTFTLVPGQGCVILPTGTNYEVVTISQVPILPTASRPAWSAALVGFVYFDSTLGKLVIAGASAYETVTSG